MLLDLAHCGSIEDVELGVRWDRPTLAQEVDRRAATLSRMGIGSGSIVAITHGGSARFFADLFAIWSLHAAAACLDSALTSVELSTLIEFIKPVLLLGDRSPLTAIASVPVLELATSLPCVRPTTALHRDPDAPALLLTTSGTTGTPKVVVLSYRSLGARLALNASAIGRAPLRRALVTLPTNFGHGLIGNSLTPLLNGGDIVVFPRRLTIASRLGNVIDNHDISFLSSVPSFWKIALQSAAPPSGKSLLRVHVGSAPLAANLWSEIAAWSHAEVVNCYGMTETANWMAGASSRADFIADGFVGKTWGGNVAVRSDKGSIIGAGEGEVVVKSPTLMMGYLNQPELSAAAMTDGWYRTGDRGRVDEFGRIWLTGRIKDEINRAGFKIQPAEIDILLEQHSAVAEACTFAVPDPISGETVGAAVRLGTAQSISIDALRAWCRERLHGNAVPTHWFIVESIPRNARGKVSREAVRRMLVDGSAALEPRVEKFTLGTKPDAGKLATPTDAPKPMKIDKARIKNAVAKSWISMLGPRSFYEDLIWNDAGGDSLGALQLLAHIEEQLQIPIPMSILRDDMRPSELPQDIARACATAQSDADVSRKDDALPLVFLALPAHGDTPELTQFRETFAGRIRFQVIRYPSLGEMIEGGAGFDLMVDAAITQILLKCGDGACRLAGYSFGGFVAFEAARRLVATGRRVDFLGLIDSRFHDQPKHGGFLAQARSYLLRNWLQPREVYYDALWLLARYGPQSLLRGVDRLTLTFPPSLAFRFRLQLLTQVRANSLRNALQSAKPRPLEVPTTLFRTVEAAVSNDHGWGTLCGQLVVRAIGGDHWSLFKLPFRANLCNQFVEAVEAAFRVDRLVRSEADHQAGIEAPRVPSHFDATTP